METLQRTANRGSISTGFDIDNSLKVEPDNTEYASFTPSSAGNRKTYTISMWVKRTELGQQSGLFGVAPTSGSNNETVFQFGFLTDSKFQLGLQTFYALQTNRVFRDTSAWYHIIVAVDTTQATATNRVRLYVNGVEETSFSTDNRSSITQNQNTGVNNTEAHTIGSHQPTSWYFAGYMAEVHHIDGQQLAPTDFGKFDEDTGIWKPKAYTGSYGTNGFYLDFENSASLGADSSGNGNDFTLNNITSADQATDTPTNNFATLNPLLAIDTAWTYTDGATSGYDGGGDSFAEGTIGFTSGKWYYEIVQPAESGNPSANMMMGYGRPNLWGTTSNVGGDTYSFAYNRTGVVFYNGTTTGGWGAYSKDDVVMVAIDADNGFAYFGVNGSWGNGGVPTSGSSGTGAFDYDSLVTNISVGDLLIPAMAAGNAGNIIEVNFGGFTEFPIASGNADANGYGNFEYAPPTGYYALCSKNLAEFG